MILAFMNDHYPCFWTACCLGINFATNERTIHHFLMLLGSLLRFLLRLDIWRKCTAISQHLVSAIVDDVYNFLCVYRYFSHYMFWGSVRRFRDALRTKHSTFRSAITVNQYCCFWTTWYKDIKDTFATFVNAILVDFYSFLQCMRISIC